MFSESRGVASYPINSQKKLKMLQTCQSLLQSIIHSFTDFTVYTITSTILKHEHASQQIKPIKPNQSNPPQKTARISTIQASQIYINYINDQLNYESQTETEVDNNTLTYQQASDKNDIWRRREWYKRWRMYPKRVLHSLVRFHSVTLMQRSFEMIISSDNSNGSGNGGGDGKEAGYWWKVSDSTMNKLTTDTFREAKDCSKRIGTTHVVINDTNASRISNQDTSDDSSSLSTTTTTTVSASTSAPSRYYNTMDYGKEMVITCLMAGLIPYLADCTVQQLLLFGRYYYNNYYKVRRGSSNNNSLIKNVDDEDKDKSGDGDNDNHDNNHNTIDNNDVHKDDNTPNKGTKNKDDNEVLLTSLIVPSIKISVSRILGLCMASLGGALGSIYYPGWGTLIGSSAGDAFSSAMMDA